MDESSRTGSKRSRVAILVASVVLLVAGVGLGVILDRLWLRTTQPITPETPSDPRLVGRWLKEESQTPLVFKPDGTFEYTRVTMTEVPVFGSRPDDIKKEKEKLEDLITGQYRWIDRETIEILEPDMRGVWVALRFKIEGDRLTLLPKGSAARRYIRDQ